MDTRKEVYRAEPDRTASHGMPLSFWLIWAGTIVVTAVWNWWGAVSAGQQLDVFLLVLRCLMVGLIGLIVLTRLEARLALRNFLG